MALPGRRIRVMAGTPIEVGERRILPSVLVTTVEGGQPTSPWFRSVRMRPISFVVQGADGAQWQEIPDTTRDALASMAAAGVGVSAVALVLILLIRLIRG